MTPNDRKREEPIVPQHWAPLDPKVKRAVRRSLADWLAKEYAPPAEISPELRALLVRIEECENGEMRAAGG
jgi:hypothetical protein